MINVDRTLIRAKIRTPKRGRLKDALNIPRDGKIVKDRDGNSFVMSAKNDDIDANSSQDIVRERFIAKIFVQYNDD